MNPALINLHRELARALVVRPPGGGCLACGGEGVIWIGTESRVPGVLDGTAPETCPACRKGLAAKVEVPRDPRQVERWREYWAAKRIEQSTAGGAG